MLARSCSIGDQPLSLVAFCVCVCVCVCCIGKPFSVGLVDQLFQLASNRLKNHGQRPLSFTRAF